jgi:transcription initiation factor TFIIE subunit beta
LQTRQALTAKQINDATYVDIAGNSAVFESLRNNPKVRFDGRFFSYKVRLGVHVFASDCPSIDKTHVMYARLIVQPTHNVTGKDGLLALIADFRDGVPVKEVEDAYPSVLDDLQVTNLVPGSWLQAMARLILGSEY